MAIVGNTVETNLNVKFITNEKTHPIVALHYNPA
jgi:hypothetical protein